MAEERSETRLRIIPFTACKRLFLIAVCLVAINLLAVYLKLVLNVDNFIVNACFVFFDASRETTIPTLFSVLLLFLATVLLGIIYVISPKQAKGRLYWMILAFGFAWLTIDEASAIHENFNKFRDVVNSESGLLYYTWIIPYSIIAAAAAVFFIRFLKMLGRRTQMLFIISGALFVGAAIGFEIIEGYFASRYGVGNLTDKLLCTSEEFLEMTAIIIFIYALLDYLARLQPKTLLVIEAPQ